MTCGFRLYRCSVLSLIFPHSDDFTATSEIMLRALINGLRIVEYPTTNFKRDKGTSKMRILRVAFRHLCLLLKTKTGRIGEPLQASSHLKRLGKIV